MVDRVIAPNSVPYAYRDVAPGTGTPQYFTSGDPSVPTPATELPGYFMNQLMDEIIAVVVAGGLTPSDADWTQLLQAIRALIAAGVAGVNLSGYATLADIANFITAAALPDLSPYALTATMLADIATAVAPFANTFSNGNPGYFKNTGSGYMHAFGQSTTSGAGTASVSFLIPFAGTPFVVATSLNAGLNVAARVNGPTPSGFSVATEDSNNNIRASDFTWQASGF